MGGVIGKCCLSFNGCSRKRADKEGGVLSNGGNSGMSIEALRKATGNFSEQNKIGTGGFAVVYKGVLQDGTTVAVKRMRPWNERGVIEFQSEVEMFNSIQHRNLVRLLGYCNNGEERLLVYEFMSQGSLADHLFASEKKSRPPLTWEQRMVVALDVARGLEYLHSNAKGSFIHRDVKPANILLGDGMRAKVCDFGLVRLAPGCSSSIETRMAGTIGYLAPEYHTMGRVTSKVDVYAFGLVLMELITGRKALDKSLPEERKCLEKWLRPLLEAEDTTRDAVDPVLREDSDTNAETFESIRRVAALAKHCTETEPDRRADMRDAVRVLESIAEQWSPAAPDDDEDGSNSGSMTF